MTNNPYVNYCLQKGYSRQEARQAIRREMTFPCTIGLRTFQTKQEYEDVLHDFLNGQ